MKADLLLLDNLDSFSFNLVEAFERQGRRVLVLRNDCDAAEAFERAFDRQMPIVISPGPGRPAEAGCAIDLIRLARTRLPLLGICLGQQAIVEEAGGEVTGAPSIVHGKSSLIHHDGTGPFAGLHSPIRVGRYHSLCTADIPARFHVHAELQGMAMAISDPEGRQVGLQFHPESILSPMGDRILANILDGFGQAARDTASDRRLTRSR